MLFIIGSSAIDISYTTTFAYESLVVNFKYIQSLTNGSYVNFPYNRLCNYKCDYYGENVYRLEYVKKKYDPCNVFTFPQGI